MNNIDKLASRQADYINRSNIDAQQKKAATEQLTTTFAKDSADLSGANKGEKKKLSTDGRDQLGKTADSKLPGTSGVAQPVSPEAVVQAEVVAPAPEPQPLVNPNALPDGRVLPTEAFQAGGAGQGLTEKGGMTAEQMQMLQMKESDANQARTIYMQMIADRQKSEAQSRALLVQTQQDIFNILVGITTNKAKAALASNQAWDKYIQS
jgi:hypothetical protein